jgi:hypothetical protein
MGLDVFLSHKSGKTVELPSKKYPKHLFKIGYLRSSYNSGGLNNYLDRKGIDDLYWVFQPNDRYEFVPNWEEAKSRIDIVLGQFDKCHQTWRGKYDVDFVGFNALNKDMSGYPKTKQEAQFVFGRKYEEHHKQIGKNKKMTRMFGSSFTCREGAFWFGGFKIVAALPGFGEYFKEPGVYLMYENASGAEYYRQSLEITKEMIEFVLNQKRPQDYGLHWSG